MAATTTVTVPHLGGIRAGYWLSSPDGKTPDPSKPTCVLINSMCTTVSLYRDQFANKQLTHGMNLLAIEPLGHGATSCHPAEHFTYWDSAIMALQVMDKLGIDKAFALGTSQGGWVAVRMALLAPERIRGLMLLGTSIDYESSVSRTKACWDPTPIIAPFIQTWSTPTSPNPEDFLIDEVWCGMVSTLGFGLNVTTETIEFWKQTLRDVYKGDEGRKKVRMATMNLLQRDGLGLRVRDVKCPVYWLQGTEDTVYSKEYAQEQSKLFISSVEVKFSVVEGGAHYLNVTTPMEVAEALLELVSKYKQ
ncbi:hypothetical protein AJ80_02228 [Polytolypa hystricis UAMH7299]|uniref:AB hydrolase-1 domain-containing protein n=1 Tax=Polytolypa hystricis (strain UAMH7299) TaxID=1447883 RepID=A0A2B7YSD3_POLH7|nr:hypothetical protein AJ80_02228 [Polytolypa hystricis UAMH7299]